MKAKKKPIEPLVIQAGDFYMNDNGLMVFTAKYHLRRGYCCANGCLHCPFRSNKEE